MSLNIEVNDDDVNRAFRRLAELGSNPRPWLEAIGDTLKNSTRLRFVDSKAPDGSPWKAVLRGGKPLRDTGVHLMNAISARVDSNSVTVGVPFAWASVHQFGATIRPKNAKYLRFKVGNRWAMKRSVTIPARPFLGISGSDKAEILGILRQKLLDA